MQSMMLWSIDGEHKSQILTEYLVTIGPLIENTHLDVVLPSSKIEIVSDTSDKKEFLFLRNLTLYFHFEKIQKHATAR